MNNLKKYDEEYMLGDILVEKSHPVTKNLSEVTEKDIREGIRLLIKVDEDILKKYNEVLSSDNFKILVKRLEEAFSSGNRVVFSGCGATARESILLDSMWRNFWQKIKKDNRDISCKVPDLENLTCSIATGADYSIIKAVEGFEDYDDLGEYQVRKAGIKKDDVIIALTGTAETASIIGTINEGLRRNASVFLLYNILLDENLLKIKRAKKLIDDDRIIKLNIATGPMAIMGSTRMQSTSMSQLTVSSALEIALSRYLLKYLERSEIEKLGSINELEKNNLFDKFNDIYNKYRASQTIEEISRISTFHEKLFLGKNIVTYMAQNALLDVLSDIGEGNATFSLPSFKKKGESDKDKSWTYAFNPFLNGERAWEFVLKRDINCFDTDDEEYRTIIGNRKVDIDRIEDCSREEMLKFPIGYEALEYRKIKKGDGIVAVLINEEKKLITDADSKISVILTQSKNKGIKTGLLYLGDKKYINDIKNNTALKNLDVVALIELDKDRTFLKMWEHLYIKMILNVISTITMTRLKRVEGNCMVYVLPSNKKLYDRGARFIMQLTGVEYDKAYDVLSDVMDYLAPRIERVEKIIPPIIFACERIRKNITNEEAEKNFGINQL